MLIPHEPDIPLGIFLTSLLQGFYKLFNLCSGTGTDSLSRYFFLCVQRATTLNNPSLPYTHATIIMWPSVAPVLLYQDPTLELSPVVIVHRNLRSSFPCAPRFKFPLPRFVRTQCCSVFCCSVFCLALHSKISLKNFR